MTDSVTTDIAAVEALVRLTDQAYNTAGGDAGRAAVKHDHDAVAAAIAARLAERECSCYPGGFTPDTYEGPQRDCPVHGEVGALAEGVKALLDKYDVSDDPDLWECEPEDRWRFGRDLRALIAGEGT